MLGVAVLQGRGLDAVRAGGPRAAVINVNLADALWGSASPLGRTLLLGDARDPVEVVGVVPNGILGTFRTESRPKFMLLAADQQPRAPGEVTIAVRYVTGLDQIASAVRAAFHDIDSRTPIVNLRTMETQLRTLTATNLLIQVVLSVFAVVCLFVAVIGLYAMVAFTVRAEPRLRHPSGAWCDAVAGDPISPRRGRGCGGSRARSQ